MATTSSMGLREEADPSCQTHTGKGVEGYHRGVYSKTNAFTGLHPTKLSSVCQGPVVARSGGKGSTVVMQVTFEIGNLQFV